MTNSNPDALIHWQSVSKQVPLNDGHTLTILSDISLQIDAAESVAIVGSSGSGKSTLLALMAGLDDASEGQRWLLGQQLETLDEDQRAQCRLSKVGFVYQDFNLLENLTALENVLLPLQLEAEYSNPVQMAKDALTRVGLTDRFDHRPSQLSGGEQQRVALARAFVTEPEILFADEPTGNLDPRTGEEIIQLMMGLRQETGTTLVLVTHDAKLAQACQRQLHLELGQMQADSDS